MGLMLSRHAWKQQLERVDTKIQVGNEKGPEQGEVICNGRVNITIVIIITTEWIRENLTGGTGRA